MRHVVAGVLLAVAAAPGQQVIAPGAPAHGAIVANKDGLVLPAGEFTVAELIEATAAFLCRNYLYDVDAMARQPLFSLQRSLALDALGSEELLYALLATRDLVALPVDEMRGVWQITSLNLDRDLFAAVPWRAPEEILRRPRLRELVVTGVALQHVDARSLAQTLRQHAFRQDPQRMPLFAAFASDQRLLLLRGYRDQLAQVLQTVQVLEKVSAPTPAADPLQQRVTELERELAELRRMLARPTDR